MRPALHVESGREPGCLWLLRRAGISGRQSDEAGCPRTCRPHPSHHRRASLQPDSARWFGRSSTKEQWRPIVGGQRQQVNDLGGAPTRVWLKHFNLPINLTLGYNAIRDRSEQGSKPPRPKERRGPQEGVGQEGIRPPDAGMGEAGRQTEGQRQSKTEGEVNRGYLQAWGSLLVQIPVARGVDPRVDKAGKRQNCSADGSGTPYVFSQG